MNIIVDITHPAHLNLFKRAIQILHNKGNQVFVTCINRGSLPSIVASELNPIMVKTLGNHRGTTFSILFEANFLRLFHIFLYLWNKKIDVGISFGSFLMGFILTLRRKPNIHLSDDPERKLNAILELITCTERYLPPIVTPYGKTKIFNSLKEWAYLSPKYFAPDNSVLEYYDLIPYKYIFVREVSTGSLNYKSQKNAIIAAVAHNFPAKIKVILSLEDKNLISLYPPEWILLSEPVKNIHSLMYFSRIVISSGDSMAREGAMLGVPSVYCGNRIMKANQLLIDKGMLYKIVPEDMGSFIRGILKSENYIEDQINFRAKLLDDWIDVTDFIMTTILKHKKQ
jgi:uncharacterized protein